MQYVYVGASFRSAPLPPPLPTSLLLLLPDLWMEILPLDSVLPFVPGGWGSVKTARNYVLFVLFAKYN
jgi:hypothetical protein